MSGDGARGAQPALSRQLTSHLDQFVEELVELKHEARAAALEAGKGEGEFRFLVGDATDIGGGAVNQDTFDVFRTGEHGENLVLAVFDGHGRELGELSAMVARDKVRSLLQQEQWMESISENPQAALTQVFALAHEEIKLRFRDYYEKSGCQVQETPDGYLIKRKSPAGTWSCTHGGTTATVVVLMGASNRMIVANCGDSTALFGGVDKNQDIVFQELSAEHSPESVSEFKRVRAFRHDAASGRMPDMRFVYDSPSFSKNQCPSVFECAADDIEQVRVTGQGNYYKNVRNEWATLVTTPPHARFQDALAFTRSLGDLHLHVYGVSAVPEVVEYDIGEFHRGACHNDHGVSCLLVCTDGVWDNWKYNDIVEEAMRQELVNGAVAQGSAGAACQKLMAANLKLARAHFGSSADNMTAIICYVIAAAAN
jgi:serine/threonine protein phosphatase PrpC